MRILKTYTGNLLVVNIVGDIGLTSDITPLYTLIRTHIAQRQVNFAVQFTPDSFLYSYHIAVLIQCVERIRQTNGSLAVVRPNAELTETLTFIDREGFIRRVESVDELVCAEVSV